MIDSLLGLDVGTTTTKAVLFDLTGVELARAASAPYQKQIPRLGWVEQDPEEVWQGVLTAVRDIMAQVRNKVMVRAISMAAQSGSLLPANANGEPIYPIITWMDGRSENLVRQWRDEGVPALVKTISGWSLYPGLCLPTIAWLRQNDPQTFAAARHYFSVNDFIAFRLTGQYASNPSNGGGMQLVKINTGQWSDSLCALAGITPDQLSPIQPSGAIIGEIMPDVLDAVGLSTGAIFVNGGHDQGCAALGLGVNAPGKLLLACGTAWVITGVMDSPEMTSVPSTLDWNLHPMDGRWTISQSLGGLGASLEWWVNQAWRGIDGEISRKEMYASLDAELVGTGPDGRLFFLPLTGGHDDPATTRTGGFTGLQLRHTRADMARAVLESAAFELRWALESIQQAGLPVERLWMTGGAAQSPHWPSVLANVTGVPISLPQYDNWPALGSAVLAGVGIGAFESIEDGLTRFQKPVQDIVPAEALHTVYTDAYEVYKSARR